MRLLNDSTPWWGTASPSPYSIVDLIANDTVSSDLAGVLWWAVERGASVIVAAGPRGAGKTTLATTLFSFLPDDAAVYVTSGPRDPLDVAAGDGRVWLFINELSNHVPSYLYGKAARGAFDLVEQGARMVACLHATSTPAIGAVLERDAGVPANRARLIDLGVVLTAYRQGDRVVRRVTEAALLRDRDMPEPVLGWNTALDGLELTDAGVAALADWAGIDERAARTQITERTAHLVATGRRGVHTREDVTAAVQYVRRSGSIHHGET